MADLVTCDIDGAVAIIGPLRRREYSLMIDGGAADEGFINFPPTSNKQIGRVLPNILFTIPLAAILGCFLTLCLVHSLTRFQQGIHLNNLTPIIADLRQSAVPLHLSAALMIPSLEVKS